MVFSEKGPTYGNNCDYSNVSGTIEWSFVIDRYK